jgi:hypothetical protein
VTEARPLILFAHGAGAPSSSAWMRAWAGRLADIGEVSAFDYPYMKAGRKSPDRLQALVAAHREALAQARGRHGDRLVVLAGKSMGSRIGCHLAVELAGTAEAPRALVCFGYPLRSGATGVLRDEVLVALRTPILFVQGSRDALCPVADLAQVRARMSAANALHLVDGGDHSLEVGVRQLRAAGLTQEAVDGAALEAVRAFVAKQT